MNDYLLSLALGIVEGVTEFLPVSSTAHLRIAEALAGVDLGSGYWKMFTIVIQLGAIATLPIYFRARIAAFLASFVAAGRTGGQAAPAAAARQAGGGPGRVGEAASAAAPVGRGALLRHPLTLTLLAFVCTAVPSLMAVKLIGKNLESLFVMAGALVIGGVVMWVVDALYARRALRTRTERMEDMSVAQAAWVGLCQNFSAVFPGVSRSMSTIAAGQLAGMTRAAALEFSFFLSMPTMVAATGYDLVKALRGGGAGALGAVRMDAHAWLLLAIGFVVSFVVAYAVVAWFMGWVRSRGFVPFAVYRIAAGAAVLAWALGAFGGGPR
ncbi:MAG TPA: undecaprenyl-diphosphate phosphatase [Gemmatimonadales bacterium]|nr:undecaprenyl-diphosphate phosphatase [Gemmatimonadales bacterium]